MSPTRPARFELATSRSGERDTPESSGSKSRYLQAVPGFAPGRIRLDQARLGVV